MIGHFFLRAFASLRQTGVFGLIGTNTLAQGDTREGSLALILADGGTITRAEKRVRWLGEAAVIVSIVHIAKGHSGKVHLNGQPVSRISAYLVEGDFDKSPARLASNARKSFQGSIVLGMGFTFDDVASAKGESASLKERDDIIESDQAATHLIHPYIGGEELNNSPTQSHHRFVINVNRLSLDQIRTDHRGVFDVLDLYVRPYRQKEKNKKNGPMYTPTPSESEHPPCESARAGFDWTA